MDGIGFVLTGDDPFIGFDFDHIKESAGQFRPDVQEIIDTLKSYAEMSPSDEGVHILCIGQKPEKLTRCKRPELGYEVYDHRRYLTVTGVHIGGYELSARQSEIESVCRRMFEALPAHGSGTGTQEEREIPFSGQRFAGGSLSNDEVLSRLFREDGKWRALYHGDISAYSGDHSAADFAICRKLAFYTGNDAGQIDAIFRSSGLMREKWDRKTAGTTYGAMTIQKAVASCSKTYAPSKPTSGNSRLLHGRLGDRRDRVADEPDTNRNRDKTKDDTDDIIEAMNRKYAVVMLGGKCRIMREHFDPVFEREDIVFSPVTDFHAFHSNRITYRNNQNGDPKPVTHSKLWVSSPKRREYDGLIFKPPSKDDKSDIPGSYYNLWRGFGIKGKPDGDWSLYRQHVREVICNGNEDHYRWVLAWIARIVQEPGGKKPGTSICMKGKKGTGKGTFCAPLRVIFGRHFLQLYNQRQITGNFNSHLKDKVCLFCDEGFWGGSKQDEGVLKGLITEPTIPIKAKGQDLIEVQNHVNLIMATNNEWFVPTSFDERRFFVAELNDVLPDGTQNRPPENNRHFRAIWKQLGNGGAEAMLYDLQRMDISGIDLRNAPKTGALLDQIECSLRPVQRWWYQRLHDGENIAGAGWLSEAEKSRLYQDYRAFAEDLSLRDRNISPQAFGKRLMEIAPSIDNTGRAGTGDLNGRRPKVYRFDSLEKHREEIEKLLKFKVEWETPLD